MASSKLPLFYTIALLALLSILLSPVDASAVHNHRMIVRKRQAGTAPNNSDDGGALGVINAIGPNTDSQDTAAATGTAAGNNNNNGKASATTDAPTGKATKGADNGDSDTSSDGGLLGTILNGASSILIGGQESNTANATASSTSSTESSTSSSSSESSSSSSSSNTALAEQTQQSTDVQHVTAQSTQTLPGAATNTQSADLDNNSGGSSTSKVAKNTIIIIASIGGGVGLIILLWTVFRKMKLGTSKEFDERLNPIDWQPTGSDDPPMAQHRRASVGSQRSFHSASTNQANYGAAQRSMISDLPNHDFTAGPAGLAPGGGYADLYRGPSPAPSDHASLRRGPSTTRGPSPYGGAPDRGAYGGYGGY